MGRTRLYPYDAACPLYVNRWGSDNIHCRVTVDGNRMSPIPLGCPPACPRRATALKIPEQAHAYAVRKRRTEAELWDECT